MTVLPPTSDLDKLLAFLHPELRRAVEPFMDDAEEIKVRFGRPLKVKRRDVWVSFPSLVVTQEHLTDINAKVLGWRDDDRKGIDGTGHRLSRIPSATGKGTDGVTLRVGRYVTGVAEFLRPALEEHPSLLIAGRAGTGKTTLLRDVCRILGETWDAHLVVVDTSMEVAGDGRVPHPAIGDCDRLQVPSKKEQAGVIFAALRNHNARVIVVDEVGYEDEARVLRHVHNAGVHLVATTHGHTPEGVIGNVALAALLRPEPVFHWLLVVRERGVFDLYDLHETVAAVDACRKTRAVECVHARGDA